MPAFLAALVLLPLFAPAQTAAKPNVIVLLTDDQGYGDIGRHGNPVIRTPHLDRLHDESVRFTDFHVDSYCTPTRAALLTGRYAHRVGGWGTVAGRNMLRDDETTMAEVFRHNGYRTGLFGKWHLGANYPYRPIDRGFDEWLGRGDGGAGCTSDYWGNDRVNDRYLRNGDWEAAPRPGYECDVFFEAAMQFIRAEKARPFFVYLATFNPHSPFSVPGPAWARPYLDKVPAAAAHFFASITRFDENLGRLRAFLAAEGLQENTLILFLTDNGTSTGESVFNAGMRGKKGSPYDGGHRVPCFLHWPAGGFNRPVAVDSLTAHLDVLPTLVDLFALRLPKPIAFDGTILKPLLADPRAPRPERTLVLGTPRNQVGANPVPPRFGENVAVMTDRWRLVNDRELYDVEADPGQQRDLAGEQPRVVDTLRTIYRDYWSSVSARDEGWRGRPVIGSARARDVELSAENWFPTQGNCPWNQAAVAAGAAVFGHWPVRIAEAGTYCIEVRRWPRETDAPLAGLPRGQKTVDAYLPNGPVSGLLYGGEPKALPVARIQLRIGGKALAADVEPAATSVSFVVQLAAGPVDLEAILLDREGKPLAGAPYVSLHRREGE